MGNLNKSMHQENTTYREGPRTKKYLALLLLQKILRSINTNLKKTLHDTKDTETQLAQILFRTLKSIFNNQTFRKLFTTQTTLLQHVFLSDLKEPSCAVRASSCRLVQDPRPTASMLTPASGSPATIRGCEGSIHRHHFILYFFNEKL
jgi:hypothetical protein